METTTKINCAFCGTETQRSRFIVDSETLKEIWLCFECYANMGNSNISERGKEIK